MRITDEAVEAAADAIIDASYGQELPEAPEDLARAALEAAYPHMLRVIGSYEDLEGLPVETVIRTNFGTVREKNDRGYWYEIGSDSANGIEVGSFPATVIYQPNETN